MPEIREETLRMQISEIVTADQKSPGEDRQATADLPPAHSTFDLIAERARKKRQNKSD